MKLKFVWTIPNVLTTVRLLAIPFMAAFILASGRPEEAGEKYIVPAFLFFVIIWVTDAVDGFIARKFNQVSDFGKIYDPFVDKLFQFTTTFMMLLIHKMPLWVVLFIITKEAIMILGGAYMLQMRHFVVKAKWYGKITTVLFVAGFATAFFISPDNQYIVNFLFIPPTIMATVSTIFYGKDLLMGTSNAASSSPMAASVQDENKG